MYVSEFLGEIVGAQALEMTNQLADCHNNEYIYFYKTLNSQPEIVFDSEKLPPILREHSPTPGNTFKFVDPQELIGRKPGVIPREFILINDQAVSSSETSPVIGESFLDGFAMGCDDPQILHRQVLCNEKIRNGVGVNLVSFGQSLDQLFIQTEDFWSADLAYQQITSKQVYSTHLAAHALAGYYKTLSQLPNKENQDYGTILIRNQQMFNVMEQAKKVKLAFGDSSYLAKLQLEQMVRPQVKQSEHAFTVAYGQVFQTPSYLELTNIEKAPSSLYLANQVGALKLWQLRQQKTDISKESFGHMAAFLGSLADYTQWNKLVVTDKQTAFWEDSVTGFIAGQRLFARP